MSGIVQADVLFVVEVVEVALVVEVVPDVLLVVLEPVVSAFLLHDIPILKRTARNNIFFIGLCL